jgi:hypothetical protein
VVGGGPGVDNVVVMVAQVVDLEEQDHHHGCHRFAACVDWMFSCVGCVVAWVERDVGVGGGRHDSVDFFEGVAVQWGVREWRLGDP